MEWSIDRRAVIKWVVVAAVAVILVAVGRSVWRYSETALALTGAPPPADPADDPRAAFGVAFRPVDIRTFDGAVLPAWQIDGGDHWVVTVPPTSGSAAAGHRVVPAALATGATILEVDPEPGSGLPDREAWRHVHAAVRYAERQGAAAVVVAAFGDGALAVTQFLAQSDFAAMVSGVVLDAPPLDLRASVLAGLESAGVPGYLRSLAVEVAALRYGIAWADLDLKGRLQAAGIPLLVLQGSDDGFSLPRVAREFSGDVGGLADYVEFGGAAHLQAATADPAAYDAAVRQFLESLPENGEE